MLSANEEAASVRNVLGGNLSVLAGSLARGGYRDETILSNVPEL